MWFGRDTSFQKVVLTEIWPWAALQRISVGFYQRSCFSGERLWESSLVSCHKENTDHFKFCHMVYYQRKGYCFASCFCRSRWLKWLPLGPLAKLLTGRSKCAEAQVFPRISLWLTCEWVLLNNHLHLIGLELKIYSCPDTNCLRRKKKY